MIYGEELFLIAKMPFAIHCGPIAGRFTDFGEGGFIGVNAGRAALGEGAGDSDTIRVAASEKSGARSRTDGLSDIEVGKFNPFFSN